MRRAVFAFGSWFEAQREATEERPAPKHQRATVRVPRYGEAQLRAMLGLEPAPDGAATPAGAEDLDRIAAAFLAEGEPDAWPWPAGMAEDA